VLPRLVKKPWSQALFDLIVAKPVLRHYLKKHFVGPIDEEYAAYAHATAHRPGAVHAPLYFLSGRLFTRDVRKTVYQELEVPTLVLYDEDPYASFEALPELVHRNKNVRAVRVAPSRSLPHYDCPQQTFRALDLFYRELDKSDLQEAHR
jgi:pimeloyl-ACP methyl ester carboxylesterase